MRCIYEVTVEVENEIADDYLKWLKTHVSEIVTAAQFIKGELFAVENPPDGFQKWVSHYHATHRSQIEFYLKNLAPQFRSDGLNRFGKRFRAERRILILQS